MGSKVNNIAFFCILVGIISFTVVYLVSCKDESKETKDNTDKLSNDKTEEENATDSNNIESKADKIEFPKALPKLLDLGSKGCIPCKKMEPILEELRTEYEGIFDVSFIDVNKDSSAAAKYNITLIPTQIFFDAEGKELFRHVGFYSKTEIVSKWDELGINLK